jgi:molybdenum cofactor biosynthesis protein B
MNTIPDEHRHAAPQTLRVAAITISDTRTPDTDRGGQLLAQLAADAGHEVISRTICPDAPDAIRAQIDRLQTELDPHAILCTGGTGISPRDHTFETVSQLITKPLPGYGELFRWLSYQEIGSAAMLSRAAGGLIGQTLLFTMPGSPAGLRLAMEKLILPELGHLVQQARKT